MKKNILFVALFMCAVSMFAQQSDYARIDAKALTIPANKTKTSAQIADWISANFSSDALRVRAAYAWIVENIDYEKNGTPRTYSNESELVAQVLSTRKGVCSHYSYLFCDILTKMNIKSYPVRGYTREHADGENSHQWCLANINGAWYFFDPTWGAGYVNSNGTFVRRHDDKNYMILPKDMAKNYMPFDFVFQLSDYPISFEEFDGINVKNPKNPKKKYCNWRDSLRAYDNLNMSEKLAHTRNRIIANGKYNNSVQIELEQINKNLAIAQTNNAVEVYNSALDCYNRGINYLNVFVDYRNNKFKPQRSENDVRAMIHKSDSELNKANAILKNLNTNNNDLKNNVSELKQLLVTASNNLDEHKKFVDKYYRSNPKHRNQLFYVKK